MSETRYSEWIDGDAGNYAWKVRFDDTAGYLGVSQRKDSPDKLELERVILSPGQVRAFLRFVGAGTKTAKTKPAKAPARGRR